MTTLVYFLLGIAMFVLLAWLVVGVERVERWR